MDHSAALKKAAAIAKLTLTAKEEKQLVRELEEVLQVFSKIDRFQVRIKEKPDSTSRPFREDKAQPSTIDPFSNTKLTKNKRFVGPRLVD